MLRSLSLPFLLAALETVAHAGGATVGNGGDAVVCRNESGAITSAELLDLYEGRVLREFEPRDFWVPEPDRADPLRMARAFLRFLEGDAIRAYAYEKTLDELVARDPFTTERLRDIQDIGPDLAFEPGCVIEQLAVQRQVFAREDRPLLINQQIWDALPVVSRAGLYLHEVIYRQAALANGHTDSQATRYFVSYLMSAGPYGADERREIWELLRPVGLERFTWKDPSTQRQWTVVFDRESYDQTVRATPKQATDACAALGSGHALATMPYVVALLTRIHDHGYHWSGHLATKVPDGVGTVVTLGDALDGHDYGFSPADDERHMYHVVACLGPDLDRRP